jgi:HD-GYP domain-containing protein (c-di-GMP phosphodiesterase class II)
MVSTEVACMDNIPRSYKTLLTWQRQSVRGACTRDQPPAQAPPVEEAQKRQDFEKELASAHAVRNEATAIVQSIFEGVKTGTIIDGMAVKQAVRALLEHILHGRDTLLHVIHMRQYDTDLFAHAVDVCTFALLVGQGQGFDRQRLERLGVGALLHDVGHTRLPRNMYRKQWLYTEQERRLVQQHPALGAAILANAADLHEESLRIVLEHHERLDGLGYPRGLRGLQISPLSEIVSIADTYDAMLSSWDGHPPLSPAQAIRELYKFGLQGQYDRRWVERVIRCLGIYPVGSLVELSTGERGVVTAANPADALRPTVRIILDPHLLPYATPTLVNLAAPSARGPERSILRALDPSKEPPDVTAYLQGKD